ncbi:hypothetical protein [Pontibacter chitinilyticus]|uniref:hypothetical protein n=1 Tax=Pontibacter chitinilyticus TaxID=2674989 RepID=UPI003219C69A
MTKRLNHLLRGSGKSVWQIAFILSGGRLCYAIALEALRARRAGSRSIKRDIELEQEPAVMAVTGIRGMLFAKN